MRLEIGSGEKPLEGYTHLDYRDLPGVDIIDDATTLTKIEDNSCDEIKAVQVLEHFSHKQTLDILKLWYSKIKDGGFLEVEVPDLTRFCKLWTAGFIKEPWAFTSIYGGQEYAENYHKAGFSVEYLIQLLLLAGFVNVENLMRGQPNPNCEIKLRAYKSVKQ